MSSSSRSLVAALAATLAIFVTSCAQTPTAATDSVQVTERYLAAKASLDNAQNLSAADKFDESNAALDKIVSQYGNDASPPIRVFALNALALKSNNIVAQRKDDDLVAVANEIVRRFGDERVVETRKSVAPSLAHVAQMLLVIGKPDEAMGVIDELVKRFGNDDDMNVQESVAMVLAAKAYALSQQLKTPEALTVCNDFLQRFGNNRQLKDHVFQVLWLKLVLLERQAKYDEEMPVLDEISRRFGNDSNDKIRLIVLRLPDLKAVMLTNKELAAAGPETKAALGALSTGTELLMNGRHEASIAYFDQAIAKTRGKVDSASRTIAAAAMARKGTARQMQGDLKNASEIYAALYLAYGEVRVDEVSVEVALAQIRRAGILRLAGDEAAASALLDEVIRRYGKDEAQATRNAVAEALLFKARMIVFTPGAFDKAMALFDEADRHVGRNPTALAVTVNNSALLGAANKAALLLLRGRYGEALSLFDDMEKRFGKDTHPAIVQGMLQIRTFRQRAVAELGEIEKANADAGKAREAIARYDATVKRTPPDDAAAAAEAENVSLLLFQQGLAAERSGKYQQAIADFDGIDRRFGRDPRATMRQATALALLQKSETQVRAGHPERAFATVDEIVRRFGNDSETTGEITTIAQLKQAQILEAVDPTRIAATLRAIVKRLRDNLSLSASNTLFKIAPQFVQTGKPEEALALYNLIFERDANAKNESGQGFYAVRFVNVRQALTGKAALLDSLGRYSEAEAAFIELGHRYGCNPRWNQCPDSPPVNPAAPPMF
jgi:tetratricopeptide (TPR) repeat protein